MRPEARGLSDGMGSSPEHVDINDPSLRQTALSLDRSTNIQLHRNTAFPKRDTYQRGIDSRQQRENGKNKSIADKAFGTATESCRAMDKSYNENIEINT